MQQIDSIAVPDRNALLIPMDQLCGVNINAFDKQKVTVLNGKPHLILNNDWSTYASLSFQDKQAKGPITRDYAWPSKYPTPFAHQATTADFFTQNFRAFCFNEIGTSKTLSALWAADYLMKLGKIRKVLICSTLSTLERVWETELLYNIFGSTFVSLVGKDKKAKVEKLNLDKQYYIVNHDGLKVLEDELTAKSDIDLVIMDEGAVFRNQSTALWEAAYNICGLHTKRRLWWMTGNPMPNKPTDVWAQAKIVRPDCVPRYFSQFRSQVMWKVDEYKWLPLKGWQDTVYNMLKPVIRFERDQCLDLPPCVTVPIKHGVSKLQEKAYTLLEASLSVVINEKRITAVNEGALRIKLLQIASGYIYYEKDDGTKAVVDLQPAPKYDELDEALARCGKKLIIYAPFKHCLKYIAEHCAAKGYNVGMVSGDTSRKKRNDIFKGFEDGEVGPIVAHPKCMAHGLTLTSSWTIFWWAPVDDNEIYEQACGRITRPGQERKQYVMQSYGTDKELDIYHSLERKQSLSGLLMKYYKY